MPGRRHRTSGPLRAAQPGSLDPARALAAMVSSALVALLLLAPAASAAAPGPPVFGAVSVTASLGASTGAAAAPVNCPVPGVLTSVTSQILTLPGTGWLSGVTGTCRPITVDSTVHLGAAAVAGSIQGTRAAGAQQQSTCLDGSVATGIQGRAGALVDGIELLCTTLAADGTLIGAAVSGGYAGGSGGSAEGPLLCPAGAVATGLSGHDGDDLDSVALICQVLTFPPTVLAEVDNSAWPKAALIGGNASADGTIADPGQELWYKFAVQPDSRVQVDLSGLSADCDLALFKDIGQAFTTLTSTQDLTHLSAEFAADAFSPSVFSPSVFSPSVFSPSVFSPSVFSPSVFSPSVFSPSVFSPSVFSPSVFSPSVFSPSVFSPSVFSPAVSLPSVFSPSVFSPSVFSPSVFSAAFSSAQTRSLIGVSAHDGTAAESISAETWNNTGFFYVRVQGRNGASSPDPFHLAVTTTGGPCTGIALDDHAGDPTLVGSPGPATVILTDPARLPGTAAEKAALAGTLATFATQVNGAVVDLSRSAKVVNLNTQADGPAVACPYAKNLAAQAIRDIVNTYRGANSALKYVVIVGGDHAVPFFRYADSAGLGPESGYVPPVDDGSASQASLRTNNFLSQDAYGAQTDISIKGATIPVPDLAVGRLVETPIEITAALQGFLARAGAPLRPASTLTTGYDFLADAAHAVAADLAAGTPGGTHDSLITDQDVSADTTTVGGVPSPRTSWTSADLSRALFGSRHDLVFLAGHFSANSALAADYKTSVLTTDLAAAPAGNFKDALVFSAGCHSGYNIVDSDGVPGVTLGLDWSEAFAQKGATLIAGTGYQYGDTDFIEYSERLYQNFAHALRLGSGPVAVGAALVQAKQDYLADVTALQGIDQKALLESALYGLPMLGVDLPGGRLTAPPDPTVVSPAAVATAPGSTLGLQVAPLQTTPALTTNTKVLTTAAGGPVTATYLSGPQGIETSPSQPTLPLLTANVTAPGRVLRGVGFRSGTYTDTDAITPLTGATATESSSAHTPFVSSAFFPNRLATPNYFDALGGSGSGGTTRLMITPAQHRTDGPGSLTDTLRRYSNVGLNLFYSANVATFGTNTPALAAAPTITGVTATPSADGSTVAVRAHVVGDPSAGIQQVWVTYTGETTSPLHGTWASLDLVQDGGDSTLWSATLTLPAGQRAADARFLVQAVNGVGLVGVDDNQGSYFTPGITAGTPGDAVAATTLTLASGTPTHGSYGDSVALSATLRLAGGVPVSGRLVTFGIGGSSATAVTDSTGVATAAVALTGLPGDYSATATFDGDATLAPAASNPSPFAVSKQTTTLSIAAGSGSARGVTATLTGAGASPLREKTVFFVATDAATGAVAAATPAITDRLGAARLPAGALPAGDVNVTVYFASPATPLPGGSTANLADPTLVAATSAVLRTASLTSASLPPAVLGGSYSAPIAVTGAPAPAVTATGLPAGITLNKTGSGYALAGTPVKAGSYVVVLTADNGLGLARSVSLPLLVGYKMTNFAQPVNDPPGSVTSVFNIKSSALVRFQLTNAAGTPIPLAEALTIVLNGRARISASPLGATTQKVNETVVSVPMVPGKFFVYDPIARQFFFYANSVNLGFAAGHTYTITATVTSAQGGVLAAHSVVVGFNM